VKQKRYAVNVTLTSQLTLYVEAGNKTEAAAKAYGIAMSRDRLLERGDFSAIVSANDARELEGRE
jgi:hypothetical protein